MTAWVTINEASVILGMSERTIWRRVSEGKIESKLEDNKRLVKINVSDDKSDIFGITVSDRDALVRWLKSELEEKNNQIEKLQKEITNNRQRSDAIIMKLTNELEAQRRAFESRLSKSKRRRFSLWRSSANDENDKD